MEKCYKNIKIFFLIKLENITKIICIYRIYINKSRITFIRKFNI